MMSVRWVKTDIAVASVDLIYVRSSHGLGWSNLWRLSAQDRWDSSIRKKLQLNTKSHLLLFWRASCDRCGTSGVACGRSVAVADAAGTIYGKRFRGLVAKRGRESTSSRSTRKRASRFYLVTTWTNPPKAC